MERSKRKREEEPPTVITYHAPTRTFGRVFKEKSLEEVRRLVRERLGLSSGVDLRLVQLRGGARVDLDDDDDFEAFRALTYSHSTLDVLVNIEGHEVAGSAPTAPAGVSDMISVSAPGPRRKKRKGPLDLEDKPSRGPSTISDDQDNGKGRHLSSSPPEVDPEVPKEHPREHHTRPSKSQSTNGVAGPSRTVDQTLDAPEKISSLPKKNKKKTAVVADAAAEGAATPLKKRKGRDQADPYVDAERSTITLDLDSVPPEEPLLIAKKGKKRKLDADGNTAGTLPPPHPKTPSPEEGERPKKKSRKRKEEASKDAPSPPDDLTPPTEDRSGAGTKKHKNREANHVSPIPASETLPSNATGESSNLGSTPLTKTKKKKRATSTTEDFPPEPISAPAHESSEKGRKPRKKKDAQHTSPQENADSGSSDPVPVPNVQTKVKQKRKKAVDTATSELEANPVTINTPEGSAETEALPEEGKKRKGKKKGSPSEANHSSDAFTVLNGVAGDVQAISSVPTQIPEADVVTLPKRPSKKKSALTTSSPSDAIHPDETQVPDKPGKADKQKGKGRKKKADDVLLPAGAAFETTQAAEGIHVSKPDVASPATTNDLNDKVLASVARVLASQATKQQQEAAPAVDAPEDLVPRVVNVSSRKAKPKAGKSRLSQSWAPADFEPQISSHATFILAPAVDMGQTAVVGTFDRKVVSTPCLVCGARPWHPRCNCPVITAGVESIEKRILELRNAEVSCPEVLAELRGFLKTAKQEEAAKAKEVKKPKADAVVAAEVEVEEVPDSTPSSPKQAASSPEPQSSPRQEERELSPEIPLPSSLPRVLASPEIDEVVVEGKDEGSSSEGESDNDDDDEHEPEEIDNASDAFEVETPFPSFATQPDVDDESIQALLRGPVPKRSLLAMLADDSGTEEDSEPEDVVLAGDEDERDDRAFRRLSRQFDRDQPSSDEESLGDGDLDGVVYEISTNPDHNEETHESDVPRLQTEVEKMDNADEAALDASGKEGEPDEEGGPTEEGEPDKEVAPEEEAEPEAEAELGKEAEPEGEPEVAPLDVQVDDAVDPSTLPMVSQPEEESREPGLDTEAIPATSPSPELPSLPSQSQVAEQEELPQTPALPDATEVVPDSEDRIVSPSPKPPSRVSSQEDPDDPIEPADDLPPNPTPQKETEPIEDEEGPDIFEPPAEDEHTTPPPTPLSRPGTAKRMKDRHGKVPARTSYAAEVAAHIQSSMQASQQQLESDAAEQEAPTKKKAPAAKPRASRAKDKSAESSMPPPPVPDVAAPKRRGRPPLSQEEKARRAAIKEEEKIKKAAEKKALKAAEKAAAQANTKASQTKGKKGGKAQTAADVSLEIDPEQRGSASTESVSAVEAILGATPPTGANTPAVESASTNVTARPQQTQRVIEGPSAFSTPLNVTVRRVPQQMSQSQWEVLPETPQTQNTTFEAEESMYDELRSSSPELATNPTFNSAPSHPTTNGASQLAVVDQIPATNGQVAADANANVDAEGPPSSPAQEDDMPTPTPKSRTNQNLTKSIPDPLFDLSQPVLTPPSPPSRPTVGLTADAASSNSDSDSDSPDEGGADDALAARSPTRPLKPAHWGRAVPFRRLTDIASQGFLPPTPPSQQTQAQAAEERRRSMYSQLGADDDDDSSSSSDSDAEKSHIPKARRAGVRRVSNAI